MPLPPAGIGVVTVVKFWVKLAGRPDNERAPDVAAEPVLVTVNGIALLEDPALIEPKLKLAGETVRASVEPVMVKVYGFEPAVSLAMVTVAVFVPGVVGLKCILNVSDPLGRTVDPPG